MIDMTLDELMAYFDDELTGNDFARTAELARAFGWDASDEMYAHFYWGA